MTDCALIFLKNYIVIQVSGKNAQTFLQGQLTCDMRLLSEHGKSTFAACCDPSGRMIANFWVVNFHGDFKLILPESMSQLVINHLKKYAIFSKTTLALNEEDGMLASYGYSTEALDRFFADENSIRIALPNTDRHLLMDHQKVLLAAASVFSGKEAMEDECLFRLQNIMDQLCILYPKTSLLFIPQMINLQNFGGLSFDKGCYVGQEIITRTHYLGKLKRHLHYLKLMQNDVPLPGDSLKNAAGEPIGVVVDAVLQRKNEVGCLAVILD